MRNIINLSFPKLICVHSSSFAARLSLVLATLALATCTIHPRGEFAERRAATIAGKPYQKPLEKREIPLLWAHGSGADVMRRLAAPMIGGLIISFLMELLVYPIIFYIYKRIALRNQFKLAPAVAPVPAPINGQSAQQWEETHAKHH